MDWIKENKSSINNLLLALHSDDSIENRARIFDAFCMSFGVDNSLPSISKIKSYRKSDGLSLYRAYDASIKDFIKFKSEFMLGKFQRYSRSVLGNGLCFADNKSFAKYYSDLKGKLFGANIIKCKLDKNARLIDKNKLAKDFHDLKSEVIKNIQSYLNCNQEDAEKLFEFASKEDNHMIRGILLGFDGMLTQTSEGDKVYAIFNRGCLTCSKASLIGLKRLKPFKEETKQFEHEQESGL